MTDITMNDLRIAAGVSEDETLENLYIKIKDMKQCIQALASILKIDNSRGVEARLSSTVLKLQGLRGAFEDVGKFHEICDIKENEITEDLENKRIEFLMEEVIEYIKAVALKDKAEIADALSDIIYFAIGTARIYGFPLPEVWNEVQKTNMAKAQKGGKVQRNEKGKIIKPPGWEPPDIQSILLKYM